MMEDLAPAEQGDQLEGCTLAEARLAVMEAANLHASHWNDTRIEDLAWVSGTCAAGLRGSADPDAMNMLWQGFCARYGDRLSADAKHVGAALVENYAAYNSWYAGPKSLVHIDYRPDNMMFASARGGKPLTVLDWQSLSFGCGVTDVAYFLSGALDRDARRRFEKDLLREYHDRMRALGVDYDFESLWRDYRSRAFALYLVAFYASMIVTQTPRGDDMFMQMISSATNQVLDLDALEFLRA
jgi:aminoglycoside phosphotransferase (APT) family kinase protein